MNQRVRRSWLIVPAHNGIRLAEAAEAGADVVVLDLEDTVHDSRKHEARENIREAIQAMASRGAEVFVRSDLELLVADLNASVWRGLTGVLLPGVTCAEQVREADRLLQELEAERGVVKPPPVGEVLEADDPRGPEQALEIHLCLDTGRANWDAEKLIQASPRVASVSLGRADLKMDLRGEPSGELHMMPYLMQRLITIASATGVEPFGAWWKATSRGLVASYQDTLEAAITGRQAGFKGALCLRAHQVAALNEGFTPTSGDAQHARAIQGTAMNKIAAGVDAWAEACRARDEARARVIAQASLA